ncbi:MAG: hypothetical protein R3A46_12585 [Thermomicrobiales bacterium]
MSNFEVVRRSSPSKRVWAALAISQTALSDGRWSISSPTLPRISDTSARISTVRSARPSIRVLLSWLALQLLDGRLLIIGDLSHIQNLYSMTARSGRLPADAEYRAKGAPVTRCLQELLLGFNGEVVNTRSPGTSPLLQRLVITIPRPSIFGPQPWLPW